MHVHVFLFLSNLGPQQGFVSGLSGGRFWLVLLGNRWDAQVAIEYLRGCGIGDPGVGSGVCPERGFPPDAEDNPPTRAFRSLGV